MRRIIMPALALVLLLAAAPVAPAQSGHALAVWELAS